VPEPAHYERVIVPVEVSREVTVSEPGWVSRFRVVETVIREYATRVVYTLLSPDMKTVISVYEIPTRILLSTSVLAFTEFLGVAKLAEIQQRAQQQVQAPATLNAVSPSQEQLPGRATPPKTESPGRAAVAVGV
jgi:hypothetical protein